jgi:hypothetical protein
MSIDEATTPLWDEEEFEEAEMRIKKKGEKGEEDFATEKYIGKVMLGIAIAVATTVMGGISVAVILGFAGWLRSVDVAQTKLIITGELNTVTLKEIQQSVTESYPALEKRVSTIEATRFPAKTGAEHASRIQTLESEVEQLKKGRR